MILLSAQNVSRQFDVEPVFADVAFQVRRGEKIGLVGPNGTGKTTLLRIIAGLDEPDIGSINRHSSASVALLVQEARFSADETLHAAARKGLADLYKLQRESIALAEQVSNERDESALARLQKRYDQLQHELHRLDAYNIDHRVDEVLTGLGFTPDEYDRPMTHFSGGQQSRTLLAQMLLRSPDVMLLDEPTNHLDIAATEWLEDFLARSNQALILVSHDRYFLDRVTNRTFELYDGRLTDYPGNFTAYWQQREERNKVLRRTYEKQQEEIAKTEDFIRRNKYGQKHAQAADREKKLARMERVELPLDFQATNMHFGQSRRAGDWLIDAVGVSKGFGEPLFEDVTLRVLRGERIGILGPNGSGKTTLLRTLLGELKPEDGNVRFGTNVDLAYYDQHLTGVDPGADAVEAVRPADNLDMSVGEVRSLLARFGIRGDMAFQKVGMMSGGEKSRVALARLAARNANLLVLDEPTNHLDLWARASLEDALKQFEGTVLFVTHDRYFIDRVAQSVVVFEPDRVRYFEGNYSDYVHFVRSQAEEANAKRNSERASGQRNGRKDSNELQSAGTPAKRRRKFPYRKVPDIEADIAKHEQRIEHLQQELGDPELHRDGDRVKETMQEFHELKSKLAELYEHWEEAIELN